eukprot:TRINITY_DN5539_c0_g1_i1.p1 TRINITY_DN5539_c0_g1~~TRINITY_DN5539_c0_g1_i1.p1  ORF type:complete len:205 (+),score=60.63 TRINITY_DN5539_c0_g1_i1:1-615(+)
MERKCSVVGDGFVGKTSLLICYTEHYFPSTPPPYYTQHTITTQIDNTPLAVTLWDTPSHEDYDALRPMCHFHPSPNVVLCLFSVVSPSSFENVREKWFPEVEHHCPGVPVVLVGSKVDLREDVGVVEGLKAEGKGVVSYEQGVWMAQEMKAVKYLECSALTQVGVGQVFEEAFREMLFRESMLNSSPDLQQTKEKHHSRGCLLV